MNIQKMALAAAVLSVAHFATASERVLIKDPAKINEILSQIPVTDKDMNYRNIGERLTQIGMTVTGVIYSKIEKTNEIEEPEDRIGDEWIQIITSAPPAPLREHWCNIMGDPSYLKRGNRYIPQSRTAVWLMTSRCELPNKLRGGSASRAFPGLQNSRLNPARQHHFGNGIA